MPSFTAHMRDFEKGNLLQVGQDLLELLLVIEEGVVEGDACRHSVHLYPQTGQVVILNVRPSSGYL